MKDDIYVGIDIGKAKHCLAAINQRADILLKPRFIEQNQEGFDAFHRSLQELAKEGHLKIGIEATGHYWLHLYTFLHEQGWAVEVFIVD